MSEKIKRALMEAIAESNKERPCELPNDPAIPHILDSGDRTKFDTGAVRDLREGKGRCDLMPLDVVARLAGNAPCLWSIYHFVNSGNPGFLYDALDDFSSAHFPDKRTMLLETSIHFEDGAKKYGENNWQKGIPVRCYIDSAVRHYLKFRRGDKDEPHDRAFCWNIMCAIWTCEHKPELNDYRPKGEDIDMSKIVVKHNVPDDWSKPMEESV